MSERVEIAKMLFALIGAIFTPIMAYLMAKLNYDQKKRSEVTAEATKVVAVQVKEVKQALEANGDGTTKKLDAIHTLVNGGLGTQLRLNMLVTRRLADVTKDEGDKRVADLAEEMFLEHQITLRNSQGQSGNPEELKLGSQVSAEEPR